MTVMELTDHGVIPWLGLMADWSLRWGILILLLWAGLSLPLSRRPVQRHRLCVLAMVAGLLLPLAPTWAVARIPWASRVARAADRETPVRIGQPAGSPQSLTASDVPISTATSPSPAAPSVQPVDDWAPIRNRRVDVSPASPPLGLARWLALSVFGIWAAVLLGLSTRLLGGYRLLTRLRREARGVGDASQRLLDGCRQTAGLARPVALGVHEACGSPAILGGRKPLILVPADWESWPEVDRRACLVHELTHLARRDDWTKLIQELIRVVFFFHPMVRWLLHRMDRERELVCDEVVVAPGTERLGYAQLLLNLARRSGGRWISPRSLSVRPGWLPFLDRGTVAVRIERLLEDDMSHVQALPPSPLSVRRMLALGTVAVAVALGFGGLQVRAVEPQTPTRPVESKAQVEPAPPRALTVFISVSDPDGQHIPDADLICVIDGTPTRRELVKTDRNGEFALELSDGQRVSHVYAHKPGFAPASQLGGFDPDQPRPQIELRLAKPVPFSGTLVDRQGKPVAGAKVRIEMVGIPWSEGVSFEHVRPADIRGTPLESIYTASTDSQGRFRFDAARSKAGFMLGVVAPGIGPMRVALDDRAGPSTLARLGFLSREATNKPLVVIPAASISGRVVTRLPGVSASGLEVTFQPSHGDGRSLRMRSGGTGPTRTDDRGRFEFRGLDEGTVNVFLSGSATELPWTYRAAQDVRLRSGEPAEVTIELIRGVEVEGRVVAQGTGAPVAKAQVGVYGPYRPRSGALTQGVTTDSQGRFHYRLPAGETYFYVMGPPPGYARLPGEDSSQTVTIPEGVDHFTVPPLTLAGAVTPRGRIVDSNGEPVAGATIVGTCEGGVCRPFPGTETKTDAMGSFQLPTGGFNTIAIGQVARLLIRLPDGVEHELAAVPTRDGSVMLRLPAVTHKPAGVQGPRDVAPDELAGVVVDTEGKPIDGVEVDAWTWHPGNETRTDRRGWFRLLNLGKDQKIEVMFRKPGHTPQLFLAQPTGARDWVIVLGNKTYFEGTVSDPGGKPVAEALIRANNGPKRADGGMITEIWTETKSDPQGHYRLYAQEDVYDIQVRVPGVGVSRLPGTALGMDEAKRLDIHLQKGVTFLARVIDSVTGEPVAGVRLWHWQHPGIEGRSGQDGAVAINDLLPGLFRFQVEAAGYTRWWSDRAASRWNRRTIDPQRGWQRNFDQIDFNLAVGMEPVTITIERGVKVTGRVVDPDGKPRSGATVAPALTGSGNSLTGDTRFSVETDRDGRFLVWLPASGAREYNLVAHDGKYGQWRTWANGVLPPMRTKPGQEVKDVELKLTRPATVRGRVTTSDGQPVSGREVRRSAADRLENRYYDPTVKTRDDGTFELKFVRPGEQFIQVAPFWLDARQAPTGTNRTLQLAPGEVTEGVDFQVPDNPKAR